MFRGYSTNDSPFRFILYVLHHIIDIHFDLYLDTLLIVSSILLIFFVDMEANFQMLHCGTLAPTKQTGV